MFLLTFREKMIVAGCFALFNYVLSGDETCAFPKVRSSHNNDPSAWANFLLKNAITTMPRSVHRDVNPDRVKSKEVAEAFFKFHNNLFSLLTKNKLVVSNNFKRRGIMFGKKCKFEISNFTATFGRLTVIDTPVLKEMESGNFTWCVPFKVEGMQLSVESIALTMGDSKYYVNMSCKVENFTMELQANITSEPTLVGLDLSSNRRSFLNLFLTIPWYLEVDNVVINDWVHDYLGNVFIDTLCSKLSYILLMSLQAFRICTKLFPVTKC